MDHMLYNKVLSDKQFGFIGGRSTSLQLLKALDAWTKIMDDGGYLDIIYMDFAKAFDKVPHNRLIGKIASYGFRNPVLRWIKSFLSDRKQRVIVNGCPSQWENVISGIPQGSVLGPVLFVIYINDMPTCVTSDVYLFADDTKISRDVSKPGEHQKLQENLNKLVMWSNTWLLKFNTAKCKVLPLRRKADKEILPQYTMGSDENTHILDCASAEKDIGVYIDTDLSFEKHINEKVNKANMIVGIIRRTYSYLDIENFLLLYKALVRPNLEYASSVWQPYKVKDIDILENVQRRAQQLDKFQRLKGFLIRIG